MDYTKENELIIRAHNAAIKATKIAKAYHGVDAGSCGFAWVTIRPATSRLVRAMKAQGIGSRHYAGGWSIWNPSECHWQNIDVKEAGAIAYALVLREAGYEAHAGSRLD